MTDLAGWQNNTSVPGTGGNQAAELNKALQVGFPNLPGATGQVLTRQSLDEVLATTTLSMADIKLWKMLPKIPARSTVEQFVELTAYGSNIDKGWLAEIDTPLSSDANYITQYEILKQIGVLCGVSFIGMQTDNIVDLAAEAARTGTMDLLRKAEHSLWYGDPSVSPLQWQGFIPKILARSSANNVIDVRGLPLDQDILAKGTTTIADAPNYGHATHLFINTRCKGDVARGFYQSQRTMLSPGVDNNNLVIGINPGAFQSTTGLVQFVDTPFLDNGGPAPAGAIGSSATAPPVPVVSTAPAAGAPASGVVSLFTTADAGAYSYVVIASNNKGTSAPVSVGSAAIQVAPGQVVTFQLTAGGGNPTEHFRVYRTPVGGGAPMFIQNVPNLDGNGVPQAGVAVNVVDANAKLPGTFDAVMFQFDADTLRFLQLGTLTRVPFGIVQTAMQWMLLMVGAPSLRAPNRAVLYRNIGLAPQTPTVL